MGLEDLKTKLLKKMSGGRPSDAEDDALSKAMMLRLLKEQGRTISDADRKRLEKMMGESGRTISDADRGRTNKSPAGMMGGGKVMGYKEGGEVKKKKAKKKKTKMGCVMAGRGGKYKGIS